jgi:hypothetical protein
VYVLLLARPVEPIIDADDTTAKIKEVGAQDDGDANRMDRGQYCQPYFRPLSLYMCLQQYHIICMILRRLRGQHGCKENFVTLLRGVYVAEEGNEELTVAERFYALAESFILSVLID